MSEPAVSVVFRAYNCDKYIGQAIESILAQTFQDFEIVVVDDGSTDGTAAILQAYGQRDPRIKVIRNQPNQGPVRTMNIGLRYARGEFIAVHDSDDMSLPQRLETQVNFLRANPQIALVGGGAYFIDEEGEILRIGTLPRKGPEEVRQLLSEGRTFIHTSVMYRRRCIEAIGWYDEFFAYSHDYDMLIRMADAFDLVYDPEPLVKWRKLNSGITGRKKQAQAAFGELARLRHKAQKEGTILDLQQEYNRLITSAERADHGERQQPSSDASYYYNIGVQLLEQGKHQTARRRFGQALKAGGGVSISLRVLIFYGLSFLPNSINSKPVRALRKAF
jgi:glycosyltransferase involved in cell wall biosynthesis